jgi:hypothetical protein
VGSRHPVGQLLSSHPVSLHRRRPILIGGKLQRDSPQRCRRHWLRQPATRPTIGSMWLKDNSVGRISNENPPKSQSARAALVNWDETCGLRQKKLFRLWQRVRDGTLSRSEFQSLVSPIQVRVKHLRIARSGLSDWLQGEDSFG